MTDEPTIQQTLSDELDKVLLKGMDGITVLDNEGNPVKIDPPAALLNVARQRLKDLGITKVVTADDPVNQLMREIGKPKFKIVAPQPVDDAEDAAVTDVERATGTE